MSIAEMKQIEKRDYMRSYEKSKQAFQEAKH